MSRFHVDTLVEGRTDGLVIQRSHYTSVSAAGARVRQLAEQPPYYGEVSPCDDPSCRDFDITRQPGDD